MKKTKKKKAAPAKSKKMTSTTKKAKAKKPIAKKKKIPGDEPLTEAPISYLHAIVNSKAFTDTFHVDTFVNARRCLDELAMHWSKSEPPEPANDDAGALPWDTTPSTNTHEMIDERAKVCHACGDDLIEGEQDLCADCKPLDEAADDIDEEAEIANALTSPTLDPIDTGRDETLTVAEALDPIDTGPDDFPKG